MIKVIFFLTGVFILWTACIRSGPEMPSFNMLLIDSSTVLNTKDIPSGKPTILVYYSPDCDHCQKETADILKKMDSMKQVQFYFITTDPFDRMKVFRQYYKIDNYSNIILGRDYESFFPRYYQVLAPPYSNIYDKNKRLVGTFAGEATATDFITLLKEI
jgi:thiol-disulfide isomerase/thioredoxin